MKPRLLNPSLAIAESSRRSLLVVIGLIVFCFLVLPSARAQGRSRLEMLCKNIKAGKSSDISAPYDLLQKYFKDDSHIYEFYTMYSSSPVSLKIDPLHYDPTDDFIRGTDISLTYVGSLLQYIDRQRLQGNNREVAKSLLLLVKASSLPLSFNIPSKVTDPASKKQYRGEERYPLGIIVVRAGLESTLQYLQQNPHSLTPRASYNKVIAALQQAQSTLRTYTQRQKTMGIDSGSKEVTALFQEEIKSLRTSITEVTTLLTLLTAAQKQSPTPVRAMAEAHRPAS